MTDENDTLFAIADSGELARQLERYDAQREPAVDLLIKVGGTWISGDGAYLQDTVAGYYANLLAGIADLYEGVERVRHTFMHGAWITLEREGDMVTVEKRVSEQDVGMEQRVTTRLDTLASAAITGANELLEEISRYEDPHIERVQDVRESIKRLSTHLDSASDQ